MYIGNTFRPSSLKCTKDILMGNYKHVPRRVAHNLKIEGSILRIAYPCSVLLFDCVKLGPLIFCCMLLRCGYRNEKEHKEAQKNDGFFMRAWANSLPIVLEVCVRTPRTLASCLACGASLQFRTLRLYTRSNNENTIRTDCMHNMGWDVDVPNVW